MPKIIGIDLGTTNSTAAATPNAGGRILENRDGKALTRSVVGLRRRKGRGGALDEGELLIGDVAVENWPLAPEDTVNSIKRLMGRRFDDKEVQKVRSRAMYKVVSPSNGTADSVAVVMGGKEYSPVDISAMILKKVKEDAEFRLNDSVTHAVITVPAYFSQRQKRETREAGQKAGLKVIKILDEPTAAAIAFGMEAQSTEAKYVVVYDLGGGTFDISVLMWAGSVFVPLNLEGNMWLGGDDFDQVLVDRAVKAIKDEYKVDPTENKRFMVELKKKSQSMKESLSSSQSATLIVAGLLRDEEGDLVDFEMDITRAEYERMIQPLVEGSVSLVKKALEGAKLGVEQIHYVLMAGSATGVPLVQEAMERLFGKDKIMRNVHPKHSVALGAAILAARIGQRLVCQAPDPSDPADQKRECGHINESDAKVCARCGAPLHTGEGEEEKAEDGQIQLGGIAPFSYGVRTADDKFSVYIKKGESYPTLEPVTQTFYTITPNQRIISIPVYGGEHLDKASLNEKQGEAFALLPPSMPKGASVLIKVWLDSDGVFLITAHLENGLDLKPWELRGGAEQKAAEELQRVEQLIAEKARNLSAEQMDELEAVREQAFDCLRRGDFQAAAECAQQLDRKIDGMGHEGEQTVRDKAENYIGFTQFVLNEFGWAFDANQMHRLNTLVGEVQEAMSKDDAALLQRKFAELDAATNKLPDIVHFILNIRGAIRSRIQPVDPTRGTSLSDELDQLIESFRMKRPDAVAKLNVFSDKVMAALRECDEQRKHTSLGNLKCPNGHDVPPGQRYCPQCNYDTYGVTQERGSGGSSVIKGL